MWQSQGVRNVGVLLPKQYMNVPVVDERQLDGAKAKT